MPQQMKMDIETLLAQLEKIKETHGEEAFQSARRDLAVSLVAKTNGETFIRNAFPDMDIDELKKQAEADKSVTDAAPAQSPESMMLNMVRAQVPNLKTQAEFNYFMAAFDALRLTINCYLGREYDRAEKGREALNGALDTLKVIKDTAEKLEEIPEDQRSEVAKEFAAPAKELHEHDDQRRLLVELAAIDNGPALNEWYDTNRDALDGIVSQRLRNQLFDEIRRKRNEYKAKEAN